MDLSECLDAWVGGMMFLSWSSRVVFWGFGESWAERGAAEERCLLNCLAGRGLVEQVCSKVLVLVLVESLSLSWGFA